MESGIVPVEEKEGKRADDQEKENPHPETCIVLHGLKKINHKLNTN